MLWRNFTWLNITVLACGLSVPAYAQSSTDLSQYRVNTYGTPDYYVDVTRSTASNGIGTIGDPWNLEQAQSLPACGDVVGFIAVGAGTPVQLQAPATESGGDEAEPGFDADSVTDCTVGSPLVFVTQYAAVALSKVNIGTNQNRTELRHAGTGDAADVGGTGGAIYGSNGHNYITYDGFYIDMAQAEIIGDSGVFTCRNTTGVKFLNFHIKGTVTDVDSNAVIYRPDDCLDTTISNFLAYDFDNQPTGTGLNQEGQWSDQYGDRNILIEHFEISGLDRGIFYKGTSGAGSIFNYGTIRYGVIYDVIECIRISDPHSTELTTIQNVLCYDFTHVGINLDPAVTTNTRNILIDHVTAANGECASINAPGPVYITDPIGTNVTIRNSIFDWANATYCNGINASELSGTFPTANYNGYYRGGNTVEWSYNAVEYNTIGNWRSNTSQEAQSTVLSTSPFTNRASSDYTVASGHFAETADSDGGEIGAYGDTTATIGIITVDSGGGGGVPGFYRSRRFKR